MQITRRHYAHAPITEAVIAIGYEPPKELKLEDLLRVHSELVSDYPKRAEQFTMQFQLEPADKIGKAGPSQIVGYRLTSPDGKRNIGLTLGDYTFSLLAPYDRWETLREEAKRVWTSVEALLQPRRITRVSVRFINRIDMPDFQGNGIELDDYFRAAPRIPSELPQTLKTYFVRLELPFQDRGILILTLAAVPPASAGKVSALLDLDAIMQNTDLDATNAWRTIEELRDVKNAAFEASITDAARELFK